ncbi:hypothetical protein WJX73_003893 [Symbiochloris irregularis]|uniref:E1 ubiquitin-activating enzyme n=1 Tax=Symbiochloris irregularis TaxID=706552 RepID=A0AAW1PFE0_9CHLO
MSKRAKTKEVSSPVAKKPKMANGSHNTLTSPAAAVHQEIDEDLHSRQLAVYGRGAMRRMAESNILICGLGGLGVETAKNVILAGVKSVTLHDTAAVQASDLSAQFYLAEADVGSNRAQACQRRLQELNPAVAVSSSQAALDESFLTKFQVVVLANVPLAEAVQIDRICHAKGVAVVSACIRGVFAYVFCDFGPRFIVNDTDGEEPHTGIVASITATHPTVVTCVEDERLQFQDGEHVIFSEVEGMPELNKGKPFKVINCKAHSFQLEQDITADFGTFVRGGLVTQHKTGKTLAFKPLEEALKDPGEFLLTDFAKMERPGLLHLGFQALDAFQAEHKRLPKPYDAADADAVVAAAQKLNAKAGQGAEQLDEALLKKLAWTAAGELSPMAAVFGGIVGQETVKAITGKFTPIHHFLYFDAVEALPADPLPAAQVAAKGGRYDSQVAVFGSAVQQKIQDLKLFLVGAGALGCEFLKNFALMGVGCNAGGRVTVTDDDIIEKSNLSRQFLFRDSNIGSAKSSVAARAATVINPAFNVHPLQNRVSPETEEVFDDSFWEGLDMVVNALDNVNARLYVDSRCVYFCKPLLESGTLGPKCNTQMVIPRLTENYGSSRDPPEKQAPMCTLHSFPHNIDHCLTFARSEFEGLLEKAQTEANAFLSDTAKYLSAIRSASDAAAREQLEKVVEVLVTEKCRTFEDCIAWARKRFQVQFHDRIAQLVYTFPEDAATSSGARFWSAPKRFPHPLDYSATDDTHASLVQAAAILKAESCAISVPKWASDAAKVAQLAGEVDIPAFVPRAGVQIETDPKATSAKPSAAYDDEAIIEGMITKLQEAQAELPKDYRLVPVVFEKDDDTNYHMDLITGLANMRARNYQIQEVDKFKAKLIAGKIIPAIATTTAMATGLVCLELYKVLQSKAVEDYRNTFANLAIPLFAMSEPLPPKTFEFTPQGGETMKWSLWDRWILKGDLTVQETLNWFKERGLEAYSISCGQCLLYSNIFPKHRDRLTRKMSDLVQNVAKVAIPANRAHFDVVVACEDEEGEDLDVPLVSIEFRAQVAQVNGAAK